jgi:23S rRNA (pseudouridine1915-N3)-methyltransferase
VRALPKVLILAYGKLKTPGLREAADYYLSRLSGYAETEETELKPEPVTDKSKAARLLVQEAEATHLMRWLEKNTSSRAAVFLLDERGKTGTTLEWTEWIKACHNQGISELVFVIGSSLGFSDSIKKHAKMSLSLGSQTLPHELARVVLLEQLYRAHSVISGHPYHNEGA